jgi:hypothetical protein
MGIEPEPFKEWDTGLAGQLFDLTAGRDTKDNLLPTCEQPLCQPQHWFRRPSPPSVAQ